MPSVPCWVDSAPAVLTSQAGPVTAVCLEHTAWAPAAAEVSLRLGAGWGHASCTAPCPVVPTECGCHSEGATSAACDPMSGQCPCRAGLAGRRCDRCLQGHWGFPRCQPCACNGHAEACHPLTGACQACLGATAGWHCERWVLPGKRGEGWEERPGHPCAAAPGAWTATMETPPWAQASGAGPAAVLGPPAPASITGRPATRPARVGESCASAGLAMQVRRGRRANPGPAPCASSPEAPRLACARAPCRLSSGRAPLPGPRRGERVPGRKYRRGTWKPGEGP